MTHVSKEAFLEEYAKLKGRKFNNEIMSRLSGLSMINIGNMNNGRIPDNIRGNKMETIYSNMQEANATWPTAAEMYKELKETKKWTISNFAEKLKCAEATISRGISGKRVSNTAICERLMSLYVKYVSKDNKLIPLTKKTNTLPDETNTDWKKSSQDKDIQLQSKDSEIAALKAKLQDMKYTHVLKPSLANPLGQEKSKPESVNLFGFGKYTREEFDKKIEQTPVGKMLKEVESTPSSTDAGFDFAQMIAYREEAVKYKYKYNNLLMKLGEIKLQELENNL